METTRQALDAGHDVRALARSANAIAVSNSNLEKIRGNSLKIEDVEAAVVGVDVVIQTLGVGLGELFQPINLFSDATRIVISAMKKERVSSGYSVLPVLEQETAEHASAVCNVCHFRSYLAALMWTKLYKGLIKESGLDWTIARPGVLTNGPHTGRYQILSEPSQWRNGVISRANVAEFLVQQIKDEAYVGKAPVLIN